MMMKKGGEIYFDNCSSPLFLLLRHLMQIAFFLSWWHTSATQPAATGFWQKQASKIEKKRLTRKTNKQIHQWGLQSFLFLVFVVMKKTEKKGHKLLMRNLCSYYFCCTPFFLSPSLKCSTRTTIVIKQSTLEIERKLEKNLTGVLD